MPGPLEMRGAGTVETALTLNDCATIGVWDIVGLWSNQPTDIEMR